MAENNREILEIKQDILAEKLKRKPNISLIRFLQQKLDKLYKKFNIISGVSSYHLGRDDGGSYKHILEHPNLD